MAFRVVFVCSGNTCRSPMAQAILKDRIRRDPRLAGVDIEVRSAGLDAFDGDPPAEGAVRALSTIDLSLDGHTTTRFGQKHLDFDLILTMTEAHKSRILLDYPEIAAKVYTLKEYGRVRGTPDIADPFMQGDEAYRDAMRQIDQAVAGVVDRLAEALSGERESKQGE